MATKPLIKSYQFSWEALKFTGKHWKIVLLVCIFPLWVYLVNGFLYRLCASFSIMWSVSYITLLKIVFPFWLIGWFRFLLLQEKPTLRSYFTLDKTFFMVFLYGIILGDPRSLHLDLLYYLSPLTKNWHLNPVLSLAEHVLQLMGWAIFLPLKLIFPALVCHEPFPFWKAWSWAKPFYGRYIISTLLLVVLWRIINYSALHIFDGYSCLSGFWRFGDWFSILLGHTVAALYYREFLKGKK